ncbi:hypothetical protein YC2023_121859 [Brassica napus]
MGDKTLTVRHANQGTMQPKPEQENEHVTAGPSGNNSCMLYSSCDRGLSQRQHGRHETRRSCRDGNQHDIHNCRNIYIWLHKHGK